MTSSHTFRSLHHGDALLLLPNAWDAGSARLIESVGAKAVATTSAGLAWSRGYADGEALPVKHLLAAVREIARVIEVPLSIDIESGYSDDPSEVAQLVTEAIDAGVAGINIEDGAGDPELLYAKIEAARQSATSADVDLFINARTDVYLRSLAEGHAAVAEVIRRSNQYRAAGCDGLFVPALADPAAIAAIAAAVDPLPLNIMLVPGLPSTDVLRARGVRRLSTGPAIAQAVLGSTSRLATDFLAGAWDHMFSTAADYAATNQIYSERERS